MLRTFFVSLSRASWAQRTISSWGVARRAASRFVAGETIREAIQAVKILNSQGIRASLDHLGENTLDLMGAQQATDEILAVVREIDRAGVQANVSLKLSQIGLNLGEDLCYAHLAQILALARSLGGFVRVDMEESAVTAKTIGLVCRAMDEGYDNVGIVIQAYLRRSEEDVRELLSIPIRIRLCKGAYQEPPELAFPKKADVDANYDRLARILLEATLTARSGAASSDGRFPPIPALATHDPERIKAAQQIMETLGLAKGGLEFQMLYGIRRDLQQQLAADGYPVRVYVPYGTHWYPYFMRRLGERPANIWFFISNYFRR
jgi:proline dehydrogenase